MGQNSTSLRRRRGGFTLVAVVVGLMVVVIIAAVAAPYVSERNDQLDATQTAQILASLTQAFANGASNASGVKGYCNQIGTCPRRLAQLTTPITQTDSGCIRGKTVQGAAGNANNWLTLAPYSGLPIVQGYGVPTPLGVIQDTVIRVSATVVELHIDSVSANRAGYLDVAVDGAAGAAAGSLQYGATSVNTSGQQLYLVKYQITIASGKCS